MEIIKILVVDDEARMRKLVKDFLSVKGYKVVEAADGEEAISLFMEQKDIKLILLDVMMPKMDGFETLKLIRQYSDLPVIMLTARSEERDELQGFNLGVDEYITQPEDSGCKSGSYTQKKRSRQRGETVCRRNSYRQVRTSGKYR